jgi:hypothetical protein
VADQSDGAKPRYRREALTGRASLATENPLSLGVEFGEQIVFGFVCNAASWAMIAIPLAVLVTESV